MTYAGFFRQNGLILAEAFVYGKEQEPLKNIYHNRAKKFTFLRRFDCKNMVFEISRNLIRNACFQITLNARKSCVDSFLKIKTDDNRARFARNQQSSEKFESETSKLYSVNLSKKRRDIVGVHQRGADSLQRL